MKNAIVLCIVFMSSTFLFGQKEKTIIRTKTKIGTHKRAPLEIESYYPGNDTVYYYSRSKVVGNDTILISESLNGYQNPYVYPLVIKNRDSVKSNNFSVRTNSIDFYSTDETELFTNRTINLTKNSGSNSITVDVSENAFQLLLKVNCHLESGTIDVEIYDPENTKVGEFSLDGNIKYKENKG